jgi:cytochrome c oxidase assembly protein subunit 15
MTAQSILDVGHADERPAAAEGRGRTAVKAWLWLVAALIFAMVVVGGATRLTGSGLSITEWKPIMGALPPLTHADWEAAFTKYREIPQFSIANRDMTLAGFQVIFWWEWSHRFLGRLIGVVFFVPFVAFLISRQIRRAEIPKFLGLFILGGLQGLVGWWMVASGLVDRIDVAPYRLALHLTLACLILVAIAWTALTLDRPQKGTRAGTTRVSATILLVAVMLQIFLGALVAGNDAGLVYNTWPTMNGTFVPPDILAIDPLWRNFFENQATVQFVHRLGAYTVFVLALIEGLRAIGRAKAGRREGKWIAVALLVAVSAQACIGISTLLWAVPLPMALLHQAGAIVVLLIAVVNWVGAPVVTGGRRRALTSGSLLYDTRRG